MSEIEVRIAPRYIRRKSSNAVGKNILKTLTEPITNSDDSYRILSAKGDDKAESPSPIIVQIDKRNRLVKIIDHAEGMTKEDLEDKFRVYGAGKSGAYEGYGVRGLFGQGVSDVLFYHSSGVIKSIKDGRASICRFYEKKEKRFISAEHVNGDIDQIAKKWGINNFRGTIIEFIADKDTVLHEYSHLAAKLSSFYAIKLINSDANRSVILQHIDSRGRARQSIIKYTFPKGEPIDDHREFEMTFEKYPPVKIDVDLYKSDESLSVVGDEKESGLLVYDDKGTVYDQTFFGLDGLPGSDKYYGFMKLTGAREIILDKINKKHPEEILLDTRDGFNEQHEFYKNLQQIIKDWLYPIISRERKKHGDDGLSEAAREKHKLAFDELNKFYSQLTGESTHGTIRAPVKKRPAGGIEFARNKIEVTVNKKYGLQLVIDTRVIKPGSIVTINSTRKNVGFSPESILIKKPDEKMDGLLVKTITIFGAKANTVDTIEAISGRRKTSVVVSVIYLDIFYPDNGIAFSPDYFRAIENRESTLWLFIDTRFIKNGDEIKFMSSNKYIKLKEEEAVLSNRYWRHGTIVRLPVAFVGEKTGESGVIDALCRDYSAQARVDIRSRSTKNPSGLVGKFRGWDFDEKVTKPFQATYDPYQESPTCGFILVNPNHPVNIKYFGENPKKSDLEESTTAQLYLAELILNEVLNVAIPEAIQKGTLPKRSDYDVLYYISQNKYELGPSIYKHFVEEKSSMDLRKEGQLKEAEVRTGLYGKDLLGELSNREIEMIEMRFGLNDQYSHTLEEIARKFNLTRERIRQIINAALKKEYGDGVERSEHKSHPVDYIKEQENRIQTTIEKVIEVVAKNTSVSVKDIKGRGRQAQIAEARQLAMYLARSVIGLSFPSIGNAFKRDHTTALFAFNKIGLKIKQDKKIEGQVDSILRELKNEGYTHD
ncbi:MAG: helix-turn-helix domain-containing protein [Candidatus Colwellbacteria bacterium]|nr:helix-turn-helix domain-containing protein [Candidatus Colwellbacteria bacterium]